MALSRQMDCCRAPVGISGARCCYGAQQVRGAAPAAPERSARSVMPAPAIGATCGIPIAASPIRRISASRIDSAAAPPGGTLIAQHTSLLL
jgi:hypothetical protein